MKTVAKRSQALASTAKPPRPVLERVAIILLCIGAVLGPVVWGGAPAWPRFALEAIMAAATILWALSSRRATERLLLPVVFTALASVQLIPLTDSLLVAVAPVSAGAWKIANEGMPWKAGTISVDPAATAAGIRRLLLGLSTITVVADLARYLTHRRRLIAAIAFSGALIWLLGLVFAANPSLRNRLGFAEVDGPFVTGRSSVLAPVQSNGVGYPEWVTAGTQRYKVDESGCGNGPGTYIYANHFAGGLCLTTPVLFAGVFYLCRGRLPLTACYFIVAVLLAAALWTVGSLAQARAGVAAMTMAALVLMMLLATKPLSRRFAEITALFFIVVVLAIAAAMYGPFSGIDNIFPPAWRPSVVAILGDARVMAARVAFRMLAASPVLGTGLDSYTDIFPRFQPGDITLYYAHNDYAQLLAETGLVGGAVAAGLAIVMLVRGYRFYTVISPANRALEAGAWAAFAAIAVYSGFDWNLHSPANAFLASLIAGLVAATGLSARMPNGTPAQRNGHRTHSPQGQASTHHPAERLVAELTKPTRWLGATLPSFVPSGILIGTCLVATAFLFRDACSEGVQRQMREALVAARLSQQQADEPSPAPILLAARVAGRNMRQWDAGNPQIYLLLGQIHLHLATLKGLDAGGENYAGESMQAFEKARSMLPLARGMPESLSSPRSRKK